MSLHDRDEALEAAIFDAARRRLAEPPALGSTLDGLPAPAVTRGGSRRRARRRAAARRGACRPPSRSTTGATSRSSRRLRRPRPRSPTCCSPSTPSTAARGSRPPARCTPRTRRWRGWRRSPASPTPPAAASSRAARTGTCRRSTPPASMRATAAGRPPTWRATRRCTRPCARWRGSWTPRCWPCPASGSPARRWRDALHPGVFAVVATAGTTNLGTIDDLAGVAAVCAEHETWLHVDGAYGLAALCAPSARPRFAGLERADSFIVDPHKWLFSPFDCCALVYRDPAIGRAAHRQHAAYLESLYADDEAFNPSDYGLHLTRRARGLPLWFALAVHGTDAFEHAVERSLEHRPRGGRRDPQPSRARAAGRARADGPRVPPPRLDGRRLRPLGRGAAHVGHRVRDADHGRRRDRRPAGDRQPAHHARRRQGRAGRSALRSSYSARAARRPSSRLASA